MPPTRVSSPSPLRASPCERERLCVCVCVRARARVRVRACECVIELVSE